MSLMRPNNAMVLNLTLGLTLSITIAQLVAAWYSNSLALLADGVSMFIDSLTYMVNRYAESRRGTENGKRIEFAAASCSVVALFAITIFTIYEASKRLLEKSNGTAGSKLSETGEKVQGVDMRYVLAFGIAGILFDTISLTCFYLNDRGHKQSAAEAASPSEIDKFTTACSHVECDFEEQTGDMHIIDNPLASGSKGPLNKASSSDAMLVSERQITCPNHSHRSRTNTAVHSEGRLNMRSALIHSAGDLLRSTATIISSAVSLLGHTNPEVTDAACAIAFSVVIAFGGITVLKELCTSVATNRDREASSSSRSSSSEQLVVAPSLVGLV